MVRSVFAAAQAAVILIVCALSIDGNEASTASAVSLAGEHNAAADLHKLRHHFERSEEEHARSMSAIMENMTSHSAMEILRRNSGASHELLSLAQMAVSHTHLRAASEHAQAMRGSIKPPKGMGAAAGAKWLLNKLLEETMKKYDLEILKCRDFYSKQCGMIEASRGTIAASNLKGASCRTHILSAETQIGVGETKIPPAKQALKDHKNKCKGEVAGLKEKLKVIGGDIDTMTKILAMTDCGSTGLLQTSRQTSHRVGQSVGLLRCKRKCDDTSLVSFDHSPLRHHVDSLKSHVALKLLQESFGDLVHGKQDPNNPNGNNPNGNYSTSGSNNLRKTLVPPNPCDDPNKGAPSPKDKRAAKCTFGGSTSCTKLQERFILIQSGMKDHHDDLQDDVVDTEAKCEKTEQTLSQSVNKAEQTLGNYQTKLAEATSCENEAAEVGRLTNIEFQEMTDELHKQKASCSSNYQNYETEMCGLKKIRSELYTKMKGVGGKPFFQDCKLSDWSPSECSKECGGGVQQMTRSVESQPNGGAECLPLTEMRRCNEQPCPVDCKLSTWGGWSSCSAECGGGVQERLRDVVRAMKYNGNPCGEVSETKACNVQACEADCELADWSKWSKCSKPCDGGSRKRIRRIKTPATGSGECEALHSKKREQYKKCNLMACPKAKTTVQCASKVDLILVLDGSGSLGKEGWAATKKAAEMIIGAMDKDQAQVAILLYSGPSNWGDVRKCFRNSKINQEAVCKMKWVQHFTSNTGQALSKVKFLGWPKGSTMTSLALMNALGETQLGREDAETVVAVITDGKPLSKRRTWRAAKALRKVARLMWVPVTRYAPLHMIRRMASRRWQENVILANSFKDLEKPEFVDHIIADMCPNVK